MTQSPVKTIPELLRLAIPVLESHLIWEAKKIHNKFQINHFPYLPALAAMDFGILSKMQLQPQRTKICQQ